MASTALLGFLKGGSDEYLDHVKNREKAEAEMRKMKRAAEISHEYFKQEKQFLENLPSAREERARKRAKEQRDVESHELGMESDRLSLDKTRQDMDLDLQQNSRADRIANAQIRAYDRPNTGRSGGGRLDGTVDQVDDFTIANELIGKFEDEIPEGVPAEVVRDVAAASARTALRSAGSTQERARRAQELFRAQLSQLRRGVDTELDSAGKEVPKWNQRPVTFGLGG